MLTNVIWFPHKTESLVVPSKFSLNHIESTETLNIKEEADLLCTSFLTTKRSAAAIIWSKIIHLHYILTCETAKAHGQKPPDSCPKNVRQFSLFNCGKSWRSSPQTSASIEITFLCQIYFRLLKMCLMKGNPSLGYSFCKRKNDQEWLF